MKKRIILLICLVVTILILGLSILIQNKDTDVYDSSNMIVSDNSGGSEYEKDILNRLSFDSVEDALPIVTKNDSSYKDGEIIYQTRIDNYSAVFFQQETVLAKYKFPTIICYEFVVNENDTVSYVGRRVCNSNHDMLSTSYGWIQTVRSDLGYSTSHLYKDILNIREVYGVLPAWGLSVSEQVKNMTVDGQSVDKVIEFTANDKTYYFWFIEDLKTQRDAMNMDIKE
ncbi:MAG: hypothetical protein E7264_06625 [Lachnospiraceae bacterium]|nr:hypothetical protein [Lachnospiraceae bacterium]